MYRYILFDLDGTLSDSKEGVVNSLRYALTKMGKPVPEETTLLKFIGPPLQDSFARFCGFDEADALQALRFFKERYDTIGKFENIPTPGLPELCARLKKQGYILALASSKPENLCREICQKFGYEPSLSEIVGSTPDFDWEKKDVIEEVLRRMQVSDRERRQVLMVGDRKFDVLGAKACGLDCVGVEFFGYAEPGELKQAGAVAVVASPQELEQFILQS